MSQPTDLEIAKQLNQLWETIGNGITEAERVLEQTKQTDEEITARFSTLTAWIEEHQENFTAVDQQVQHLEQQISQLSQLRDNADEKFQAIQEIQRQVITAIEEIGNQETLDGFRQDLNHGKIQLQEAQSQLQQAEDALRILDRQFRERLVAAEGYVSQVEAERIRVSEFARETERNTATVSSIKSELEQFYHQVESTGRQIQQQVQERYDSLLENVQSRIETLDAISQNVQENSHLVSELATQTQDNTTLVSQIQSELESRQSEISSNLEASQSQMQASLATVEGLVVQVTTDKAEISQQVASLEKRQNELKRIQRVVNATLQKVGGKEALNQLREEYRHISETLATAQGKSQQLSQDSQEQWERLQARITHFEAILTTSEERLAEVKQGVAEATSELVRQGMSQVETIQQQREESLTQFRGVVNEILQDLGGVEGLEALHSDFLQAQEILREIQSYSSQLSSNVQEVSQVYNQVEERRTEILEISQQVKSEREVVEKVKGEVASATDIRDFSGEVRSLQKEVRELKETLRKKERFLGWIGLIAIAVLLAIGVAVIGQ